MWDFADIGRGMAGKVEDGVVADLTYGEVFEGSFDTLI
jgi:hypothetical protein